MNGKTFTVVAVANALKKSGISGDDLSKVYEVFVDAAMQLALEADEERNPMQVRKLNWYATILNDIADKLEDNI